MNLKSSIQDLMRGLSSLVKSEANLVRVEFVESSRDLGRYVAFVIFIGILALLGLIPFIAFLVIALGKLLQGNYWLSSLIVSVTLTGISGVLGYLFFRKIKSKDLTLPQTRNSLQSETELLKNKVHEISEVMKRRKI